MVSSEAAVDDPSGVIEEKELVRFERANEYLSLLSSLVDPAAGTSAASAIASSSSQPVSHDDILSKLISILDEYQDQSNLLDPYLERIVSPPVESLQQHVRSVTQCHVDVLSPDSATRLSKLVYAYTKVRGYKTIVHYFPHEVADLPATLAFLEQLQRDESVQGCWELRYVCLLWLSLICMIPFDLAKFDRSHDGTETTAARIATVAQHFIASPGKERDAAAVVLGRLFQRDDVQLKDHFAAFLGSSLRALSGEELSPFHATGILQALCEVLKTSEPAFVLTHLSAIENVVDAYDEPHNASLANNGLIIKYQTKLTSRLAIKLLRPRARRHANKFHVLGSGTLQPVPSAVEEADDDDESTIPDSIDAFISRLIDALQHKDTVVRYSAAKGLARLSDRLPTSFLNQVVDAIISLFHINIPNLYDSSSPPDLSSVSEHTWQGSCMALAELSRRGLLFADMLSEALPWILKALLFDVRRGAHSVGANVRDAACYVVWALARSNDTESIRPHAMGLALRLVAVATLDRDVSVRRAASAAFQESVGRLALFPHGIDVIRMTDFYTVSVRRNAFLECAVKVAGFEEYRGYLLDHLIDSVTVHWDPAMRKLGAQSVARIVMHDPGSLLPEITSRIEGRIGTSDNAILHGSLLTLAEVCRLSRTLSGDEAATGERIRAKCFGLLDSVRATIFRSLGAASILQAACQLIGSSFPATLTSSLDETQTWEKILNLALARQEEPVHVAASEAVALLSTVVDLSSKIRSTIDCWTSLTVAQQQSNTLWLGALDFTRHSDAFERVIHHLISLSRPSTKSSPNPLFSHNIEVRRNATDSLTRSTAGLQHRFAELCTADTLSSILSSLLAGLDDYTTDQRGDVGSWVRLSSISGLREILILASRTDVCVPTPLFHQLIGGLWKQAAERMDVVRSAAGVSAMAVYRALAQSDLRPEGYDEVQSLDTADAEAVLKDPSKAFPRICRLLLVPPYRTAILEGLVVSVGSKSDLAERVIAPALVALSTTSSYTAPMLLRDIFALAKGQFGNNRVYVPAISTVNLLLESQIDRDGLEEVLERLVRMALTNVERTKSITRASAAATLCANLALVFGGSAGVGNGEALVPWIVKAAQIFLTHPFPTVRVKFAEQLYAVLSSVIDVDDEAKMEVWQELELTLLDTKWSGITVDKETVGSVTAALPLVLS